MANNKLTLLYFAPPGRAAISRMILAYAGADFVNKTLEGPEFAKLKPTLPFGQLPTLTLEDGQVLCQSLTIARYLANRYNLSGHTEICKAEADEAVDTLNDVQNKLFGVFFATDKKAKMAECMPACETAFKNLEKRLESRGGQHLAGNCLTWADLMLHGVVTLLSAVGGGDALKGCDKLNNLNERVGSIPNIKKYDSTLQSA